MRMHQLSSHTRPKLLPSLSSIFLLLLLSPHLRSYSSSTQQQQQQHNSNNIITKPTTATTPPSLKPTPQPVQLRAEARTFVPKLTDRLPVVATINARSLNNKTELLNQLLSDANIDVAIISETWLNAENVGIVEAQICGEFTSISKTRSGRRGDGVSILARKSYASKSFSIELSHEQSNVGDDDSPLEMLAVKLIPYRRPRGYADTIIVGVYLAAFENEKSKQAKATHVIDNALASILASSKGSTRPLVFVSGDFNGANTKPLLQSAGLNQLNGRATR